MTIIKKVNGVNTQVESKIKNEKLAKYVDSLRFGLYVCTHPLDGFWDLIREKRGTIAAANTFLFLVLAVNLMKLQYTNFLFLAIDWEKINIFVELAKVLFPGFLAVVSNWGLTTLFDGKGRMVDIYMGLCYSAVPYILIQIPMIILSNVFTRDEGAFYYYFDTFSLLWCAGLVLCAVMMIHHYTLTQSILAIAATGVGMLIMIFVFVLFFSLVTDSFSYFVSIYRELMFRFY
ncbi:YIP1 family protein [Candidatus Epulonipiscium viviparus]|uniref:YIP1 family protein n=1 Tax=Candidatus Epulonipiscium viviparus TaxID=420336 RepID=UPI000300CA67|nr:YIP1 family protein [Candidatus Epulopiscium viviparus]